jgi:hypothetical protein
MATQDWKAGVRNSDLLIKTTKFQLGGIILIDLLYNWSQ